MKQRKRALYLARRYRACPPLDIAGDPAHSENMARHRLICPWCTMAPSDVPDASESFSGDWTELLTAFRREFRSRLGPSPDARPPAPGQIRRPCAGAWDDGWYRNPPLILLLSEPEPVLSTVEAVLIGHDPDLAGPGDLVIREEAGGLPGEFIVETGQTFPVSAADLGPVEAIASPSALEAILDMIRKPGHAPDWADRFPDIREPDDPRRWFRELEAETARFFSASASFRRRLSRLCPGLAWPSDMQDSPAIHDPAIHDPARVLVMMRFSGDYWPVAAAGDDGNVIWASHIAVTAGWITKVSPLEVKDLDRMDLDNGVTFTGHLDLPPGPANIVAYISNETGMVHAVAEQTWDAEARRFFLFFPVGDDFSCLHLAVITRER